MDNVVLVSIVMGTSYALLMLLCFVFEWSSRDLAKASRTLGTSAAADQLLLGPLLLTCCALRLAQWALIPSDTPNETALSVIEMVTFYLFVFTKWVLLAGFFRMYLRIKTMSSGQFNISTLRRRIRSP
jgi:hypothetical protein